MSRWRGQPRWSRGIVLLMTYRTAVHVAQLVASQPTTARLCLGRTVPDSDGAPSVPTAPGPWSYLWWLILAQRGRVTLGAALGSVWMVGLTAPPYLLAKAVASSAEGRREVVLAWAVALVVASAVLAWLGIWRHRTMTRVRMDAAHRTVTLVNAHAARLGASLARRTGTGEVIAVGAGDAWTIGRSLTVTGPGVGAVLAYVVIAVLLLRISLPLALVVLAGIPLLALIVGGALGRLRADAEPYRAQQGLVTTRVIDVIAGLGVLNGLGGKDAHAARFAAQSQELQRLGYRLSRSTSVVQAAGLGLPTLFTAVVVWLAARLAVQGQVSVADLVAVFGYTAVLAVPVATFVESAVDISQALVAARRVCAFLNLTRDHDGSQAKAAAVGRGVLVDQVSGLEVAPGAVVAVASTEQHGAEALLERLGGLRPGATLDGDSTVDLDPRDLRAQVLLADQDAHLFAGPLADVVTGPRDSRQLRAGQVSAALHAAAADDVVRGLEGGLQAPIAAGGANLSGGQRQRVRLARALLVDPPVLLAADATSALDVATEVLLVQRLVDQRRGKTTVLASTSAQVLQGADEVHLLVGDRVVASGTHTALMADEPRYSQLVQRGSASDDQVEPDDEVRA